MKSLASREDKVDSLSVDSIKGHNQVSGKGFPATGPRVEAGNVVIHKGLYVSNVTASCSLCAIVCNELFTDRHRCPDVLCIVVMLMGYVVNVNCMSMDFKVLRITRLICASFGITRLIGVSFGVTRLICASFGITRLMCALYETTRLFKWGKCRQGEVHVGVAEEAEEGVQNVFNLRDLIMQMREQQQPDLPAPAPVPVVPQVVSDQLSAEAKQLRDFKKYNPTTFDGSLKDPTRAQLWLSSLETIFWYMKFPEDQKVQCAVFMLIDKEFLNLEQDDMTVEQYDAEFYMLSRFAPEMIATEAARADKFVRGLRLDIQGLVRASRPATHADALRLAVDLNLQERANSSKVAGRGSTSGQKRKVELPISVPQRNFRSGGEFRRFQ
ncbi:gag-protease polyprotein [Cucumis melo var. makuwa]|uniref:Gag-protease polyprotein n=1 Tax=Cucumis melo var. makuwa TaxID=1194695 RepID=A0A5D3BR56_CUCMM|nr:gag-protease polyprotein [Cucumis melo var. makuwa]